MGLDGTIKRSDGRPLGDIQTVQQALAAAFPGICFGRTPSGADKIRIASEQGIEFPDVIRQHLATAPPMLIAEYAGSSFSAQFTLGSTPLVHLIDVVLYGATTASEPMFQFLEDRYDWILTHP